MVTDHGFLKTLDPSNVLNHNEKDYGENQTKKGMRVFWSKYG